MDFTKRLENLFNPQNPKSESNPREFKVGERVWINNEIGGGLQGEVVEVAGDKVNVKFDPSTTTRKDTKWVDKTALAQWQQKHGKI